jgi:hypothetical protein
MIVYTKTVVILFFLKQSFINISIFKITNEMTKKLSC